MDDIPRNPPGRMTLLLLASLAAFTFWHRWCNEFGHVGNSESVRIASRLVEGSGFSNPFLTDTGPTAHVAPLFPWLLSGIYSVFGDLSNPTARLAQQFVVAVPTCLFVLLLPFFALRLGFHPITGWLAALLTSTLTLNPRLISASHEQSFGCLGVILAVWAIHAAKARNWLHGAAWLPAGPTALLALGAPNLVLVPFAIFGLELIQNAAARKQILRVATVSAVVAFLAVLPWIARNYVVLGGFVPVRSNFGLELYVGNGSGGTGFTYSERFCEVHPIATGEQCERIRQIGELAFMHACRDEALAWIAANPGAFSRLTANRAYLFWFTAHENWLDPDAIGAFEARISIVVGAIALIGLCWSCWRREAFAGWTLAIVLAIMAPYLVTHVEERYRLPLVPFSALLACHAVVSAAQFFRPARPV